MRQGFTERALILHKCLLPDRGHPAIHTCVIAVGWAGKGLWRHGVCQQLPPARAPLRPAAPVSPGTLP